MNRRELMLLLGGTMAAAGPLRAQQKALPVIGFLGNTTGPSNPGLAAFHQGLSETGYVEGQSVAIEYRWAEGHYGRLHALATELVERKVDVIVSTLGPTGALAAKDTTSTIPIVFLSGDDPVERGLVTSLARPGRNLTGVGLFAVELMPKQLELLSELVPSNRAIVVAALFSVGASAARCCCSPMPSVAAAARSPRWVAGRASPEQPSSAAPASRAGNGHARSLRAAARRGSPCPYR